MLYDIHFTKKSPTSQILLGLYDWNYTEHNILDRGREDVVINNKDDSYVWYVFESRSVYEPKSRDISLHLCMLRLEEPNWNMTWF